MNPILQSLKKRWYVYVLIPIGAGVAANYYCDFVTMPRNEETISFFVTSYTKDMQNFRHALEEAKPSYLRNINITNIKPDDSDFSYFFVNKGLNVADVFILREDLLNPDLLQGQFALLKQDYLSSYFSYTSEETGHGVLLHEKGTGNGKTLSFYEDKDEYSYYIFYRKNSIHAGELSSSKFDTAFLLTRAIL